ncbi:M48 family metalloprotease, partial [bacterium]|nr:M48 family metalloprotease [bacterium]
MLGRWGLLLSLTLLGWSFPLWGDEPRYPVRVTKYDLATRESLLYGHWLTPLVAADTPQTWAWPQEFVNQTGQWVAAYVDGPKILQAALNGCPIDGQPALAPLEQLVQECCQILQVPRPRVIVRNHPVPEAYLVAVADQPHLVLTSGLLDLFEPAPQQLRFFVGRELGRLKCDQLRLRQVSFGLLTILQGLPADTLPPTAREVALTYGVGRLLTWSREGEISADRAGLICCGSPELAYEALATMLHGLRADSAWRDPRQPDFDAARIVADFRRWETETVVAAVRYVQQQPLQAPYIAERLAALQQYVASGQYAALLAQPETTTTELLTTIEGLDLLGLAPAKAGVAAYVKCYRGDTLQFTTPSAPWGNTAYFQQIRRALPGAPGEPLYFEVWNDGWRDELLGGFVLYPTLNASADPTSPPKM